VNKKETDKNNLTANEEVEMGMSCPGDEVQIDSISQYQMAISPTFKVHKYLTPKEAEILDWALGISGESGEIMEHIKHDIFGGECVDKMKLAKELGDILWYVTAMATSYDIHMEDIIGLNLHKLRHRYRNSHFDAEYSQERHSREEDFKNTTEYRSLKANILGVIE
jgi:NTP pyrophosphatase (non-canonical NTP hydrolase)